MSSSLLFACCCRVLSLFVVCCLFDVVCCSLFVVRVVCWLLCAVRCELCGVCCLFFVCVLGLFSRFV